MASIQILLVSILLVCLVQGQYGDGYEQAFGDPEEPSQDEDIYSPGDINGNDIPRGPRDVYQDYDDERAIRQAEGTTQAPVINWRAAKERFKAFYRKLRDKYRALREKARMLGNELNAP